MSLVMLLFFLSFYFLMLVFYAFFCFFFFNDTATTEIYTLSLHDALPIWGAFVLSQHQHVTLNGRAVLLGDHTMTSKDRSEEHTSELQSQSNLVCRLLLEKKKKNK